MSRPASVATIAVTVAIVLVVSSAAHAETIWGTSSAELSTDPDYEDYWVYCLDVGWDATPFDGHGLSHTDVFLGLEECVCACDPGYFAFDDTAGYGPGTYNGESCTVYYFASFLCEGDPNFPEFPTPTIKYEYFENDCEPDKIGSAYLCFYSLFEPSEPDTFPDVLGMKCGPDKATGDVVGVLPVCDCGNPVEPRTWSLVKAMYRR